MSFEPAIRLDQLGKCYHIYEKPHQRLLQMLCRGRRQFFQEFWALKGVDLQVLPGEVIGVIGKNGAGKSTLLQLVCGTLAPTEGDIAVRGRVAALLELGTGFNPEFTGRENIFLSATLNGLSPDEIEARCPEIVAFSGIRDFIDQPVKTYSSGMYVRLAFSVAINVDPDILVIDEALSVGDGDFSRRSFEKIMALKEAGKTILFCSHAMYQVEAICNRVLWLEQGQPKMFGEPSRVIVAYNESLEEASPEPDRPTEPAAQSEPPAAGTASLVKVKVSADGEEGRELPVKSGETAVAITVEFRSDPSLPTPSVAVMLTDSAARPVASAGTCNDGVILDRDTRGYGRARIVFERIPLLKGTYWVYAFLMCEKGVHFYEYANMVAQLQVAQEGLEMGVVSLPHRWE